MGKRSYIVLDLIRSQKYGLNPTESILASYLFGLISQYEPIPYNGKWYYMADYNYLIANCQILPDKIDTLRRLYKRLENIGLIQLVKIDKHVCFTPSEELRNWGLDCETVNAEKNPVNTGKNPVNTEKNPVNTEKNPVNTEKNPVNAEKNPVTPIISNIYNIIDNNIDNISVKSQTLFAPEPAPESSEKKTLFRNSAIYRLVRFDASGCGDYSEFEKKFATQEFAPVDLVYYFHVVADWSDQKNMKRTANGWLATIRNFIRGDMEKNKLKLKTQCTTTGIDIGNAIDFINNNY